MDPDTIKSEISLLFDGRDIDFASISDMTGLSATSTVLFPIDSESHNSEWAYSLHGDSGTDPLVLLEQLLETIDSLPCRIVDVAQRFGTLVSIKVLVYHSSDVYVLTFPPQQLQAIGAISAEFMVEYISMPPEPVEDCEDNSEE